MLSRPFHPALAELPIKHATRCLAVAIHMKLRRHIFQSKESQTTVAEQFQVAPKKLYEALMGKHYDPGHKLTKAEKLTKEAEKVTSATGDKHKKTSMKVDPDSKDMPLLLSNDEDNTESAKDSAKKKKLATKKPTDIHASNLAAIKLHIYHIYLHSDVRKEHFHGVHSSQQLMMARHLKLLP